MKPVAHRIKPRLSAVWIGFFLALVCLALVIGTVYASSQTEQSSSEISNYYTVGDTFTVPERTVSVGGQTVTADSTLVYPDGTVTKNTQVTLTQAGLYTVRYAAASYADQVTFRVRDKAFGVTSGNSVVSYETVDRVFPTNPRYPDSQFHKTGVMVRLEQGDTLTLAQVIDVGELTKDDVLIGLAAIPDEIGKCDFERFELVLTDVLDPSVSLRISANGYPDEGLTYPFTYIRAGGQNQPRKGYEAGKQLIHVENNWGGSVVHSFYGVYDTTDAGFDVSYNNPELHQIIKLRYDAEEVALYGTSQGFIMDFDDPTYFDDLWHGFPSGKARLTISASNYSAVTANFLITEVYGIELSDLTFYDEEKPVIEVEGDETLPVAAVGLQYPVPSAEAYDPYGCHGVQTSVFYNYNTPNPISVDYADGVFTPDRAGWYTILYSVTDYFGNEQSVLRWVRAQAPSAPQVIVEQTELRGELGTLIDLPSYTVQGGSGQSKVTVTASDGSQTVDCTALQFRPDSAGPWTITYTARDYVGQIGTATVTLETYAGEKPLFNDVPVLPQAFISGGSYILPDLYADDYTSGTHERRLADVTVYDDETPNGRTVKSGQAFTPTVTASGNFVTVKYTVDDAAATWRIPAILSYENGKLSIANYFVGADIAVTAEETYTAVRATGDAAQFVFANAILAQNSAISLTTPSGLSDYAGLRITLTDADAPDVSVVAEIRKNGFGSLFVVGGSSVAMTKGFAATEANNTFTFGYRDGMFYMDSASLAITEREDGKPFTGFVQDKVWLIVEFLQPGENAELRISDINGQPIIRTNADRIAPSMQIYGSYGGAYDCGSVATLPLVRAADVLDPNITFTLTVTSPSGKAVTASDGTLLDGADPTRSYEIMLSELGNYRVSYEMSDTFEGRESIFVYQLSAMDSKAPVLSYEGEWATTAKAGELYVLPTVTATDDYDGVTVLITVTMPNGRSVQLESDTNALYFTAEGRYKLHIMAIDASGNTASDVFFVTVAA
mgnify:CR=1 FL=1